MSPVLLCRFPFFATRLRATPGSGAGAVRKAFPFRTAKIESPNHPSNIPTNHPTYHILSYNTPFHIYPSTVTRAPGAIPVPRRTDLNIYSPQAAHPACGEYFFTPCPSRAWVSGVTTVPGRGTRGHAASGRRERINAMPVPGRGNPTPRGLRPQEANRRQRRGGAEVIPTGKSRGRARPRGSPGGTGALPPVDVGFSEP